MEQSFEIDLIALKYIREENLTPEETVLLYTWMNAAPGREAMLESIKNGDEETMANLRRLHAIGQEVNPERVITRLELEGHFQAPDSSVPSVSILVTKSISSGRRSRQWLAEGVPAFLLAIAHFLLK